jgi:hypothetical protein
LIAEGGACNQRLMIFDETGIVIKQGRLSVRYAATWSPCDHPTILWSNTYRRVSQVLPPRPLNGNPRISLMLNCVATGLGSRTNQVCEDRKPRSIPPPSPQSIPHRNPTTLVSHPQYCISSKGYKSNASQASSCLTDYRGVNKSSATLVYPITYFNMSFTLFMLWYATAIALILRLLLTGRRPKNYPPGPPTLPIIGNLHQMPTRNAHLQFERWARQYGPVYSLILGSKTLIVLSSDKAVKDLLDKRSGIYSHRQDMYIGQTLCSGGLRVLMMVRHDSISCNLSS